MSCLYQELRVIRLPGKLDKGNGGDGARTQVSDYPNRPLIGVGIGLLIAPTAGAELRARLAGQLEARRTSRAVVVDELDVEVVGVETVRA